MFVANRKEECDFDITVNGETWHIEAVWMNLSRLPAWYDGTCIKQGIKFNRIFSPGEVKEPEVTYATK